MIRLEEPTKINGEVYSGSFEINEPVEYLSIVSPRGEWEGYVPRGYQNFFFQDGKLISESGREVPSLRKKNKWWWMICLVLILIGLVIFWKS